MIRRSHRAFAAALVLLLPLAAHAQIGATIVEVQLEEEGRRVNDPALLSLVETTVGEPLSMQDVRETTTHLMSLGRFADIQTTADALPAGVRVRYMLVPLHPIDRVAFRGDLGLPAGELQRVVQDRFGRTPLASRAGEIVETLRAAYRRRGYPLAAATTRLEETHDPDRATLIIDIQAGRQATIGSVQIIQVDQDEQGALPLVPDVREGRVYDAETVEADLEDWVEAMHDRGFYAARASHGALFPDGTAYLTINVARGPRVTIAFSGDELPASDRERLVPVREEGTADEDLLEDSARSIEDYLLARGYRDAKVAYTPVEKGGELTITFDVMRGPRYVVDKLTIAGATSLPAAELRALARIEEGRPFVQAAAAAGAQAIQNRYRSRGFVGAVVKASGAVLPAGRAGEADRRVEVTFAVTEGPRTMVRGITFQGNSVLAEATLFSVIATTAGSIYSEVDVANDRDRIDLEYRNRGYDSIVVDAATSLADNGTQADVTFTISEGPQVIVDDVIIVGQERTSRRTIERELLIAAGKPLGYSDVIESRTRLMALGLFSTVQIEPVGPPGATRRDVIVRIEEADATTIGGGGGLEGGFVLRAAGETGQADEQFELAPRGFFEIGRRNLWGKNRSVTLFTRLSLRSRNEGTLNADGTPILSSNYGFHEYRVVGTYREPRVFETPADVLITAFSEQAIRSSFNFSRRVVRAEAGMRAGAMYSVAGRYSFEYTKLFETRVISDEERPLIDRLFPEVRLSKLSGSIIRDTRDDILDATRGQLITMTGDVASRSIGSEVGFVKSSLEGFSFHRLPSARQTVLALAARLGMAHGFKREAADGQVVQDLPASERFFAGGESTVRGFSLDRLGNAETISETGFPRGGNGLVVLNAELRVALFGPFQGVGFLDAGNVFPSASDLDLSDLRTAAGFGVRYRSPFGPIRVDVGFNLDRRELVPGTLEQAYVFHISLGQAF
jgi:outer membrane protein insertion porin family